MKYYSKKCYNTASWLSGCFTQLDRWSKSGMTTQIVQNKFCPLIFLRKCYHSKYILGLLQAKSNFVSSPWINLPFSIFYLAYRAIVEEEEGTDESKRSSRIKVGTQPAQNTPYHWHRVSMSKHYKGFVPLRGPEVLQNHWWPSLTDPTVSAKLRLRLLVI